MNTFNDRERWVVKNWQIVETALAVPQRVVTNDQLSRLMDTSDEWIRSRTGIKRRHISQGENTSVLASRVARQLLRQSGWSADQLDLIIVATMSPDAYTPSTAAIVQGQIGASNAACFDLSAACSGFVYALTVAAGMLQLPGYEHAMVIGSEVLSKLVDWHDRSTAVLFGDGAGGVLLGPSRQGTVLAQQLNTFGELSDKIVAGHTIANTAFPHPLTGLTPFAMDGRGVYTFATHQVPRSIRAAAEQAGVTLDQIGAFLLHQANARIIKQVAKRLGQPLAKFPLNIDEYGNTSAASEAILLAECAAWGIIHRGDIIALAGFGGGLTTATMILKY